jgi:hypothetical protein
LLRLLFFFEGRQKLNATRVRKASPPIPAPIPALAPAESDPPSDANMTVSEEAGTEDVVVEDDIDAEDVVVAFTFSGRVTALT